MEGRCFTTNLAAQAKRQRLRMICRFIAKLILDAGLYQHGQSPPCHLEDYLASGGNADLSGVHYSNKILLQG